LNTYWGDTHLNLHEADMARAETAFEEAVNHLDFFMPAYYPADYYTLPGGLRVESVGMRPQFAASWRRLTDLVRRNNRPGKLVSFAGYEWTGNRRHWGDVNVFFFGDDGVLDLADALPELHEHFRGRRVLIIPHHTAYLPHQRGKDWSCHDSAFSPVTEIFSAHGSSEACRAPQPMNRNTSMGPRTSGGTAQDALDRGLRVGFIGSGDSHYGFPGVWGTGLVAAQSEELTREAIWNAFFQRRVYAVTGDRIQLAFTINGCRMGGRLDADGPLDIRADVCGADAIDRIELIRDGRAVATHCHADSWPDPAARDPLRFKVRIECGWGPKTAKGYDEAEKEWPCRLNVPEGRIVSVERCFTWPGQRIEHSSQHECRWRLRTPNVGPWAPWTSVAGPHVPSAGAPGNQAVVFELEIPAGRRAEAIVDDVRIPLDPKELLARSSLVPLLAEAERLTEEKFGVTPGEIENPDAYFLNAWKIKVHRAAPHAAYCVARTFQDSPPPGPHYYYLRISQLNGQMAWSSPIWVTRR